MSIELLRCLQSPILKKLEESTIANLSDVLFAYSVAGNNLLSHDNFIGQVQRAVFDKLVLKDYFNTLNATKVQWALAKNMTKELSPAYNFDVAGPILSRLEFQSVDQIGHMVYKEFTNNLIEKKKAASPENISQIMYSHAAIGYHN